MKLKHVLIAALCGIATITAAFAADKIIGGPKGGRLLESNGQKAEFFVTTERKADITFYDAALKPVAPGEHVVTMNAELKTGRVALDLEKTATGYVTTKPLPEGEPYRIVVQMREKAGAKPQNFRVDLNLEICGGCKRAEYACTCDD